MEGVKYYADNTYKKRVYNGKTIFPAKEKIGLTEYLSSSCICQNL